MKQISYMLLTAIFLFTSCNKDESLGLEVEEPRVIEISVLYEPENASRNTRLPDNGAKVFIYYEPNLAGDPVIFDQGNLTNIYTGALLFPHQVLETDKDGRLTFTPEFDDKEFLVFIESHHYPGQVTSKLFPSFDINYKCTFLFLDLSSD
ncbi:hypothetical protein [Bacteroides sp. UBA939]|uniref:hypothetical protein n=1 Tax=Bacteroides sp. UBA939 TaxID=1946092 RepID=UPI0025C60D30|nr:hypothetical protein [Bacteroides sp. UBA939]